MLFPFLMYAAMRPCREALRLHGLEACKETVLLLSKPLPWMCRGVGIWRCREMPCGYRFFLGNFQIVQQN